MLLPPGHPALLLLAGILLGAAAQDPRYTITQPESLSAPAGGSVTLPCAFTYPPEIEPLRDLRVYWRRGGFYGEFIYNHTEGLTRPDYRSRIALVGDPRGSRTASIRIDRLRELDASEYVCQIRVQKNNGQWDQWRGHPGTRLTVTALTTHVPSTEQATISATTQRPAGLGAAPVIGGALAGAILLAGIIGLAVYGARKRTGGRRKDPSARRARGQSQAEGRGEYMEIGAGGQDVPPPQRPPPDPQDPGLLYAALAFAEPGTAPRQPEPRGAPTDETLYSAVRVR
ncbi:paired immunoglobulin-like type 2 receptor alpha [Mauremys mutica]|uniref:paired immunoglobulin-like type 2 receptor alpha n=1 Tax=Mauremys mutica TaxID=74926 RepID=UPI001D159E9C|nr:paired immunoglobulin-like type 2 receptor alpha [Mauremys mutica]